MTDQKTGRCTAAMAAILAIVFALAGCSTPTDTASPDSASTTATTSNLVLAVASNGNIYTINPASGTASSSALLSVGQKDAAGIAISDNVVYVAIPQNAASPGLYIIDLSKTSPSAKRYFSEGTNGLTLNNGIVYAAVGDTSRSQTSGSTTQYSIGGVRCVSLSSSSYYSSSFLGCPKFGVAAGYDAAGQRYLVRPEKSIGLASLNGGGNYYDCIQGTKTYQFASAVYPSSVLGGTYNGTAGIFVGCICSPSVGTDDELIFIPSDATVPSIPTDVTPLIMGTPCTRLAAFDTTHLIMVGVGGVSIVTLEGSVAAARQIDSTVNATDVVVYNGTAYIAGGTGLIYTATVSSTSLGSISVGSSSDTFTAVGEGSVTR